MADDAAWDQVYERIHAWADLLRGRGVASLLETITHAEALPRRMLGRAEGERELTDLRHIGQLLHVEATSEQLGTTALTAWLGRRIAEAREDTINEDRSRRLESDSEAVQVLTIYASKGLEFPIVYCPYLWGAGWIPEGEPPVFHDPAAGDRRTIDIGGERPGFGDGLRQYLAEERGEELRLAYVALTRARHQAVVWWASSWNSRQSALARLLFPPDEGEPAVIELPTPPSEDDVIDRLTIVAADAPDCISIERTTGGDGQRWVDVAARPAELHVRPFRRSLDERWRRASYTGLTARAPRRPRGRASRRKPGSPTRSRGRTGGACGRSSGPRRTEAARRLLAPGGDARWHADRLARALRSGACRLLGDRPHRGALDPARRTARLGRRHRADRRRRQRTLGGDRDAARPAGGRCAAARHRRR